MALLHKFDARTHRLTHPQSRNHHSNPSATKRSMDLLDPEATDGGKAFCILRLDDYIFRLAHFETATTVLEVVFSVLDMIATDIIT